MSVKRISEFPKFFQIFAPSSSVARVTCAHGAKNIVAPPTTKATDFEGKSMRKSAEEAKKKTFAVVTFVLFQKQLTEFNTRNAHEHLRIAQR